MHLRNIFPSIGAGTLNDRGAEDCFICAIALDVAEASVVYEDDHLIGFLDINPVTEGHLLVAPKSHLPELADLDAETLSRMIVLAQRLAQALRDSRLRCEGVNLFYADGEAAFQEVFHAHLHVFPRYEGDSFRISADWGTRPARAELDEHAALIREALQA